MSVGSMWTPSVLAGISSAVRSRRRPVSVVASALVKKSFGQGCRQTVGSSGSHFGPLGGVGWQAARSLTSGVTGEPALFLPFFFFLPLMSRPCSPLTEQLPIALLPALESCRFTVLPDLTFAGFVSGTLPEDWMPSMTRRSPLPPLTRAEIDPELRIACCCELSTLTLSPPLPFFLPSAEPTSITASTASAPANTSILSPLVDSILIRVPLLSRVPSRHRFGDPIGVAFNLE